eukprot:jgi/Botrbrau1/2549/Bobra.0079s0036.1
MHGHVAEFAVWTPVNLLALRLFSIFSANCELDVLLTDLYVAYVSSWFFLCQANLHARAALKSHEGILAHNARFPTGHCIVMGIHRGAKGLHFWSPGDKVGFLGPFGVKA